MILVRALYQDHVSGARTNAFFYIELIKFMAMLESPSKSVHRKILSSFNDFLFVCFIAALMQIPNYTRNCLYSKVKLRKPDKCQVNL